MSSEDQRTYRHRIAEAVQVRAAPSALFDHLDDHESLASHMMQSSSMMAGGAMTFTFDAGRGRTLGSRIGMTGKFLGLALEMSEVVTEREPPCQKSLGDNRASPIAGDRRLSHGLRNRGCGHGFAADGLHRLRLAAMALALAGPDRRPVLRALVRPEHGE